MLSIYKELAITEDLELGFGTVEQTRDVLGAPVKATYKKISSETIPAKFDDNSETMIQDVLDEKLTEQHAVANYAKIGGDELQEFLVKTPVLDDEATTKKYVDDGISTSYSLVGNNFALKADVIEKDNIGIYTPTKQYHPATKLYVDQKVVQVGAGDMAKATYDTNSNGKVDDSDALGGVASDKVMLTRGAVTDCDTLSKVGIYHGVGVANSPVTGEIMVESFVDSTGIVHQRLVDKNDSHEYSRSKIGGTWSSWQWSVTDAEIVDTLTSTDPKKVLSAKQGKTLNDKIVLIKSVPIGTIVMYHGQISTLDSDWRFCDGVAPTPDLRDMFISGAVNEGDIGITGGTELATMPQHTHSINHSHTASSNTVGDHKHSASHDHSASSKATGSHTHSGKGRSSAKLAGANGGSSTANFGEKSVTTGSAGSHSHTITVNTKSLSTSTTGNHSHTITVAAVAASSGASGGSGDNRPPYYKLAYIMKVA